MWPPVKVRLQTRNGDGPKGMLSMFTHVFKHNGVLGLYKGLSASILRQLTYSTTRFGIYEKTKEYMAKRSPSHNESPSLISLIGMASGSGFLGGIAGNPADVLNVRMQHDAALPSSQQRNYRNAIDGLIRVSREEGWRTLFRGVWPNSMRAMLMTASQLASYDGIKGALMKNIGMKDNLTTHFSASIIAGFIATTICSPVDVVKTRIMTAHSKEGIVTFIRKIGRQEGMGWMFRGWVPSFVRLGPHTVATFLFLEQHKKMYRTMKGSEEL